ncbi:MAG: hypothetical protein AM326_03980 [Candidatus Thorarchaeota archaeon SMTZ-45]|nr:MAG: hypothetical protein AM326_03980 [Candidatus Thorarchaeota archaeon SMTZ-45]KXH74571.1 MAG: hypothetical protein AM325_05465 [Candidatus Thorarchaeota archaeon SMTZ1-45]
MPSNHQDVYQDIHAKLRSYSEVYKFFTNLEQRGDVKRYCNGSNIAGRWFFQIFNREFVEELAQVINRALGRRRKNPPVLEAMSGDGRLTEFLQPLIKRRCIATDSKDGRYNIGYPKWVEKLDAMEAISKYSPAFIIICWEPYLSTTGIDIVKLGTPTAWIGNPRMCGHTDIFEHPYIPLQSKYALSRHDYFLAKEFKSDIFFFNCKPEWI